MCGHGKWVRENRGDLPELSRERAWHARTLAPSPGSFHPAHPEQVGACSWGAGRGTQWEPPLSLLDTVSGCPVGHRDQRKLQVTFLPSIPGVLLLGQTVVTKAGQGQEMRASRPCLPQSLPSLLHWASAPGPQETRECPSVCPTQGSPEQQDPQRPQVSPHRTHWVPEVRTCWNPFQQVENGASDSQTILSLVPFLHATDINRAPTVCPALLELTN